MGYYKYILKKHFIKFIVIKIYYILKNFILKNLLFLYYFILTN